MFRLTPKTENARLEILPGLVVTVRPLTAALARAAETEAIVRASADRRRAEEDKASGVDIADPSRDATQASVFQGLAAAYEVEALARYGIESWEGVGDAEGLPAPVTPETVRQFTGFAAIARIFEEKYRGAFILEQAAEGNGSGRSSDGGSEAAPTATAAQDAPLPEIRNTTTSYPDAEPAPAS